MSRRRSTPPVRGRSTPCERRRAATISGAATIVTALERQRDRARLRALDAACARRVAARWASRRTWPGPSRVRRRRHRSRHNTLASTVRALIDGATVTAAGRVDVLATSDRRDTSAVRMNGLAVAVAVSLAIANPTAPTGVALSGAGSRIDNLATNLVSASHRRRRHGHRRTVRVGATDTTTATATSRRRQRRRRRSARPSPSGVALATSDLATTVQATIDPRSVTAGTGGSSSRRRRPRTPTPMSSSSRSRPLGAAGAGANAVARVVARRRRGSGPVRSCTSAGAVTVTADTSSPLARPQRGRRRQHRPGDRRDARRGHDVGDDDAPRSAGRDGRRSPASSSPARRDGAVAGQDSTFAEIIVGGVGFLAGAGGRGEAIDSGAVRALVGDGSSGDGERRR